MKLVLYEILLGKSKAQNYVLKLCKQLKYPYVEKKALDKASFDINVKGKIKRIFLKDEVENVMKTGRAKFLQDVFDQRDSFLKPTIDISTTSSNLNIKSETGSFQTEVSGPGLIEPPEKSLTKDISYYRILAVKEFNQGDISGFARAYRSYLFGCVSLVDCFLYRYYFHIQELPNPDIKKYDNILKLGSHAPVVDRIDAWLITFTGCGKEQICSLKEYSKFMELKKLRNEIVHPKNPAVSYQVTDVVRYLNYASDAVGGLLTRLRVLARQNENIGFIREMVFLPEIKIYK